MTERSTAFLTGPGASAPDLEGVRVEATAARPFKSYRDGHVDVVLLRFARYGPLADFLKAMFCKARPSPNVLVGGYLDAHKGWFVDRTAWPFVRDRLIQAGAELTGPEADLPPPALPGWLKRWYRRAWRRHLHLGPDMAEQAVRHALDALEDILDARDA